MGFHPTAIAGLDLGRYSSVVQQRESSKVIGCGFVTYFPRWVVLLFIRQHFIRQHARAVYKSFFAFLDVNFGMNYLSCQ